MLENNIRKRRKSQNEKPADTPARLKATKKQNDQPARRKRAGRRKRNSAIKRLMLKYCLWSLVELSFDLITRFTKFASFEVDVSSLSLFLILIVVFIGVLVFWISLNRKH
jgi:hypothetical protein